MRTVKFGFRWPVKQIGCNIVEMQVPTSKDGVPVLNPEFVHQHKLSDTELDKAESMVIEAIGQVEQFNRMWDDMDQQQRDRAIGLKYLNDIELFRTDKR